MNNTSTINNRDFNIGAKLFLALTIFLLAKSIYVYVTQYDIAHMLGIAARQSQLITLIGFNVLMIGAACAVYAKKRWGLIALLLLALVKMFVTNSSGVNASYAFCLGANIAVFIREMGLFLIAMCFRKNGISGWKSMLSNNIDTNSVDCEDPYNETKDDPIKKQQSQADKLKNGPRTKEEIHKIEEDINGQTINLQSDKNNPKTRKFKMKNAIIISIVIIGTILFFGMAWFTYNTYQKLQKVESAMPNFSDTETDQNIGSYEEYLVIFKNGYAFWEKALYDNNYETLLLSDTPIYGIVKHSKNQKIDITSYYYVSLLNESQIWLGDRLLRNVSQLYEDHPTVIVKKLVHLSGDYDMEELIKMLNDNE